MKTIWKYPLDNTNIQEIKVPLDTKLLTVRAIRTPGSTSFFVYAIVETTQHTVIKRTIRMYGTGWEIGEPLRDLLYIGTACTEYDSVHVFEQINLLQHGN